MSKDEYELIPEDELIKLKRDIQKLRGRTSSGETNHSGVEISIDELNTSINKMLEVFVKAAQTYDVEESDGNLMTKNLEPLATKIEVLQEQNQKIAKGIVAVSDLMQNVFDKLEVMEKRMMDCHEPQKQAFISHPQVRVQQPPRMQAQPMPGQQTYGQPMPGVPPSAGPMPQNLMGANVPPPSGTIPEPPKEMPQTSPKKGLFG